MAGNEPNHVFKAAKKNTASKKGVVSNVAKLDNEHPIPLEQKGLRHLAKSSNEYIPFIGDNDSFFEELTEISYLSPTTNACINNKTKYSIGSGWTFGDPEIDKKFNAEFAKIVNNKRQSLNSILSSAFDSLYRVGNCFVNVVLAQVNNTKKIRIYVKNNFESRLAYTDGDYATHVMFSKEFRSRDGYQALNYEPIKVPIYNGDEKQEWFKDEQGNYHIALHLYIPATGSDYYGMPSNIGGLLQALQEYKGARYNIDNFENNMVVGGVISTKSGMTKEEGLKHAKNIKNSHTGDGKVGRYVFLSSEAGVDDVDIKNFDTHKEGSFIELDDRITQKIVTANEWDSILAGINQGSSLGRGKGYFREIFEGRYNSTIRPEQNRMIEHFLNPLLDIIKFKLGLDYTANPIDIVTPMPVSYGAEIDPNKVLTIFEGRKYFPGIENDAITEEVGNQIIDQYKPTNVPNQPAK